MNESQDPTFLAFITVVKAYDRVWRQPVAQLYKLQQLVLGATAYKFYEPCDPHSGYPGWKPKFDVGAGVADHEDAVLSPFLYAVYINGLHKALANGLGVRVVGRLVPLLL